MQFVLFLFDVDTVDTIIDTCIHVHVFILVVLAFYTGLWMLQ